MWEKAILGMATLRLLSGTVEVCAALLFLKVNDVAKALMINAGLALVGPLIMLATTAIGLIGLADRISWNKMAWVLAGVACIVIGLRK